jgi:hypothetical protein
MTALASPSGHETSFADMVERMFRDFEDRLSLRLILDTVNGTRRDLHGTPVGALPELTERLARQRLDDLVTPTDEGEILPDSAAGSDDEEEGGHPGVH